MTYDNVAVGSRIPADFTTGAAARRFGRKCAIWRQRINNGCGWRQMEDRGSPAANQMDHPHISLYEQGGWLRPGDSVGGMTLVYNEKPLARPSSGRLCAGTTSWWRRERLTIWTEAGGARRAPRGTRPSAFPYGECTFAQNWASPYGDKIATRTWPSFSANAEKDLVSHGDKMALRLPGVGSPTSAPPGVAHALRPVLPNGNKMACPAAGSAAVNRG